MHTRWIETEFDNKIEPFAGDGAEAGEETPRQTVVVEVGGRRLEVSLPGDLAVGGGRPAAAAEEAEAAKRAGGKGRGRVR